MDTFRASQVIVLADSSRPGLNGFVPGSRGSLMLDVVFVAMFVVVPLLAVSIYFVKFRRQYGLHKRLQLVMAGVLLVAVTFFELDMQFFTNWEDRAEGSPYFDRDNKWGCPAGISLIVHLSFAVPTLVLWIAVVVQALRKFSQPPLPGPHSRWHARWGMLAAAGMALTAVTGWLFYWLAFMAQTPAGRLALVIAGW
jgi:putative membrane protein